MNQQACPLCGGSATYSTVHSPEGKRFQCPACSSFFIDEGAEFHLAGLPEVTRTERRKQLSQMARETKKGRLLVIRTPTQEEARTGIEGQTMSLTTGYVDG